LREVSARPGIETTLDGQHKEQFSYDTAGPRPTRHLASFAASVAAHAAIVGLIMCFASPRPTAPGDFVLAYLVAGGGGGDAGRGGARQRASGASPIHATARSAPPRAARKPRRRIEELDSEVAILAPTGSVAPAPPIDSEHDGHWRIRDDSPDGASGAHSAAVSGIGTGPSGGAAAGVGAGGDGAGGDPNSTAHADYARNPLPAYPAIARRRAEQGTVTVSVLVGADGSVERAEVADSSGFDTLDAAALETVRSRWRFVPARRGGHAVESWVLVPIRFALIEANAAR
jgi:protein TonB